MLVPGISALQDEVGARAGVTARGSLEAALPPAADAARPSRLRVEIENVRAAEKADHLAAADHRHAAYALADKKPRRLVDAGLLRDRDDSGAHDLARGLALLGEDIGLGDDPADVTLVPYDA